MPSTTIPCAEKRAADFQEWLARVDALAVRSSPQALMSLMELFYEHEWTGKEKIIAIFRDRPDKLVYPALEQAVRDHENAGLRNAAMELYTALGKRSLAPLTALLRDGNEEIRTFAGVMLGNLREKDAVAGLIEALADADLNVKHAAAEALGKIGDRCAVEPLIQALNTDMWLQFPAAAALGELGDARAVEPLMALLETPGANIPAIQALGKIGDGSALDRLIPFLEDDEPSLREWALEAVAGVLSRNPTTRQRATLTAKAADMVIDTLQSESLKARRNAAITLGHFKVAKAAAALSDLLENRDMREDALEAIVMIGGEGAVDRLAAFSRDSDPLVRRAAVEALAGIGTERSMKSIMPLLADAEEEVRVEATLALASFNSDEARTAIAGMLSDAAGAAYEAEKKALEAYSIVKKGISAPFIFDKGDITPIRDYISERLGLYYDDDRLNVLHHRLSPMAAASGFRSLKDYYRHIKNEKKSTETLSRLASQLTNNETYFFREHNQLRAFVDSLLPEVLRRKLKGNQKKITILSAGCSSGEEAYTIAILLEEAGIRSRGCSAEVIGMDIDMNALEQGRKARYAERSFRSTDGKLVKKYFREDGKKFVVNDRIKSMVDFRQGNVLEATNSGRFDVIFCRNLLIYFTDDSVAKAAQKLHQMLVPCGYLLLGHSESFCRIQADFSPVRLDGAVAYQKC